MGCSASEDFNDDVMCSSIESLESSELYERCKESDGASNGNIKNAHIRLQNSQDNLLNNFLHNPPDVDYDQLEIAPTFRQNSMISSKTLEYGNVLKLFPMVKKQIRGATLYVNGDVTYSGHYLESFNKVKHLLIGVISLQATLKAFAARKSDNSVVVWGLEKCGGNAHLKQKDLVNVAAITTTARAFAARRKDGTVVVWGDSRWGGDAGAKQVLLVDVESVSATLKAFAAKRRDGSVVVWGSPQGGGDAGHKQRALTNVVSVTASAGAFAAQKQNGSVIAWGNVMWGGEPGSKQRELVNVVHIAATAGAFAAIRANGSVVVWGSRSGGGDAGDKASELLGVESICATAGAFAAKTYRGNVVVWGNHMLGGDPGPKQRELIGVERIASNNKGFAAMKRCGSIIVWGDILDDDVECLANTHGAYAGRKMDGSIVVWGDPKLGGHAGAKHRELMHVESIASTDGAFAAKRADGSVVCWGSIMEGGYPGQKQEELVNVDSIVATKAAFAARKRNGEVVVWGDPTMGGNLGPKKRELTGGVESIVSTWQAFAAKKYDGRVVVWGDAVGGGDAGSKQSQLVGVKSIASTAGAFAATKINGTVVVWGDEMFGGDAGPKQRRLIGVKFVVGTVSAFAAKLHSGEIIVWGQPTEFDMARSRLREQEPVEECGKQNKMLFEETSLITDVTPISQDTNLSQRPREYYYKIWIALSDIFKQSTYIERAPNCIQEAIFSFLYDNNTINHSNLFGVLFFRKQRQIKAFYLSDDVRKMDKNIFKLFTSMKMVDTASRMTMFEFEDLVWHSIMFFSQKDVDFGLSADLWSLVSDVMVDVLDGGQKSAISFAEFVKAAKELRSLFNQLLQIWKQYERFHIPLENTDTGTRSELSSQIRRVLPTPLCEKPSFDRHNVVKHPRSLEAPAEKQFVSCKRSRQFWTVFSKAAERTFPMLIQKAIFSFLFYRDIVETKLIKALFVPQTPSIPFSALGTGVFGYVPDSYIGILVKKKEEEFRINQESNEKLIDSLWKELSNCIQNIQVFDDNETNSTISGADSSSSDSYSYFCPFHETPIYSKQKICVHCAKEYIQFLEQDDPRPKNLLLRHEMKCAGASHTIV